jgi:hypothetical protein
MNVKLIDALARAFGMFVFAVILLWYFHRAFPSKWPALVVLYLLCVPLASIYGLLVSSQSDPDDAPRRSRVSGLLLIAIAAAAAFVGHAVYQREIEGVFYGGQ